MLRPTDFMRFNVVPLAGFMVPLHHPPDVHAT
jgi:hypothetical protein